MDVMKTHEKEVSRINFLKQKFFEFFVDFFWKNFSHKIFEEKLKKTRNQ